ncbi:hypothetical protein POM88_044829 [Heracleum sosnowskyi]|uniref:RRM domain-containing protein n=1 Tax=Heracleum sosnowskyi TaxID=360622 RepID=A0AAD8H673_9APIA|nr:hypothetical protein POM88_044829 [Heracleum sosnowskyi]
MERVSERIHASGGRKFQISNGGTQIFDRNDRGSHKSEGKASKRRDGDIILKDFIEGNGDIVDKEVLIRFRNGDRQAITEALNQIHWRSLKKEHSLEGAQNKVSNEEKSSLVLTTNMSFAEVVKSREEGEILDNTNEWTLVQGKNKVTRGQSKEVSTIFMVNVPIEASAREIWNFFKDCGKVKDIILPRKKDRNGRRIGFIKTTNELEAGTIICNAKEKGGFARKIYMRINNDGRKLESHNFQGGM